MSNKYVLGSLEASEQLIIDLYVNLRNEVNKWAKITKQTPQARMGYIGQHLVSIVTGYPGGKSGARGYDLVMSNTEYGEIKTCYRVDQLGECKDCGGVVSSLEKRCSSCGSKKIIRKDDSKWLIGIKHEKAFSELLDPKRYYFVLFEFEDINDSENDNIVATIWEVDPKCKGFLYCMIDYYFNIRAKSPSHAPFNMWPYKLKFYLTNPKVIYKSVINGDGTIKTKVFPTLNNGYIDELSPLQDYYSSTTLQVSHIIEVAKKMNPSVKLKGNKKQALEQLENLRTQLKIDNSTMCEYLSEAIYLPLISTYEKDLPKPLQDLYKVI